MFGNSLELQYKSSSMFVKVLPNPPIAILELPNCFSHEWLTFLKRCYWLVRQEYNKHVTIKVSEQKHR